MHSLHSLAQATVGSLFDGGAAEQKSPELRRNRLTSDGLGRKREKKKIFKAAGLLFPLKCSVLL